MINNIPSPLVSILMNCFNGEKYLQEALQSLLNQSYKNWELIFWDNQSKDRSAEIFNKFKDNRMFYYYSPEFTDLGGARANACKHIKGEYLAILDCDDIWYPNKLEVQLENLKRDKYGICISNPHYFNSIKFRTLYKKTPPQGNVTKELIENYYVVLPSVLIKMSYVKQLKKFFNKDYSHIADFDLIVRLSTVCQLVYCSETLSGWRIHNTNASFLENEKFIFEKLKWVKEAEQSTLLKGYRKSIKRLYTLTKAEGCNLKSIKDKITIKDILDFSGNLKSRIKVYLAFFPYLYRLFSTLRKFIFFIRWH